MTSREIVIAILAGDADDDLREVGAALKQRWNDLERFAKNSFVIGDTVKFTTRSRFAGLTGKVDRKLPKNLEVRLPDNRIVRVSPSLVERVDS